MINKQKMAGDASARDAQVKKNPSREGNPVMKSDGKKGMEYKPRGTGPNTAPTGRVINWDK